MDAKTRIKKWKQFTEGHLYLHAVQTIGKEQFAEIVLEMMLNEEPVTLESFSVKVQKLTEIAIMRDDDQSHHFFSLASAFVKYNLDKSRKC